MKTYQPKKKEVKREWHLIDAKDKVLGRLATDIVKFLMGKNKASYSQHMDMGDFVVVKNADKVRVTGKKEAQKVYYRHSGYPSGLKEVSFSKLRKEHPQRIIELAVYRMLPGNRLRADRMERLKVVVGDKNPYEKEMKG
jgi:large subunit ribosomal protein L13